MRLIGSTMADAIVTQQASEYPRFEAFMDQWGYDWEPHQVTTEDDYILTTFHVLGKKGSSQKATEGSILIQHGHTEDGT